MTALPSAADYIFVPDPNVKKDVKTSFGVGKQGAFYPKLKKMDGTPFTQIAYYKRDAYGRRLLQQPQIGDEFNRYAYKYKDKRFPLLYKEQILIRGLQNNNDRALYSDELTQVNEQNKLVEPIRCHPDYDYGEDKDTGHLYPQSLLKKLYIKEWLEDYFYKGNGILPAALNENYQPIDENKDTRDENVALKEKELNARRLNDAVCLSKLTLKSQLALVFDASASLNPILGPTYIVPISGFTLEASPAVTNYIQIGFSLQNSQNNALCNQLAGSQPILSIGSSSH